MVGYNQNQPDVWGSFAGGMEIGGALRRRQQQQEYGQAYQQSGWEGVRDTAGGFGDLETAQGAQGVMNDAEETAITRAQRSATILSNAATSLMGIPYEQRRERIQQMAPMLAQLGLPEDQIAQFDPTDEQLANIRALQGEFSRFSEIRQQGDAIVGITPDGQTVVLREEQPQWQTNGTRPYRVTNQGVVEYGQGEIPRAPTAATQNPARPLTPEEAEAWGVGDPAGWAIRDGEAPTPVGGATGLRQRFNMSNRQRTRLQALYQQTVSNDVVLRDIARARELAPRGAGLSSAMSWLPGTDAANLDALVDTIGANIGFDRLQQMRDASPTGGALGAVTENELRLLQAVLASLRTSQSDEQFIENLNNLERTYTASMERIRQAYYEDFGEEPPGFDTGVGGGDGSVAGSIAGAAGAPSQPRRRRWNSQAGSWE